MQTVVRREQLKALVIEAMISFLEDDVYGDPHMAPGDHSTIRPRADHAWDAYPSTHRADYGVTDCTGAGR